MGNKLALRFSIFVFSLFLINGIFFLYSTVRCAYSASFYCLDEYGITLSILGASAVTLFFISLGLFILAKFYKGGRSWIRYGIPYVLLVLALIAFVPVTLFTVFIQKPSYKEWLAQREQQIMEFEQKKVQECDERRLMIAQHKEGYPMPTWPKEECGEY